MTELATVTGLASHFQVARSTVNLWVRRPDFPKPVLIKGGAPVWQIEQVQKWRMRGAKGSKP